MQKKVLKKSAKKSNTKSPTAKLTKVYEKSPGVLSRPSTDDKISIVSVNNLKTFFKVDAWAAEVWKLIDGKADLDKIIKKVQSNSNYELAYVQKETCKIIDQFKKNGLIQ